MVECLADLTVRYGGQVHTLRPGYTIDLPPDKAQRLLQEAPGRVRLLSKTLTPEKPNGPSSRAIIIEPAVTNARPIYWEAADGRIIGPAVPEFLAREGDTFWIVTTFKGHIFWIDADKLRSRQSFDQQAKAFEHCPVPFCIAGKVRE